MDSNAYLDQPGLAATAEVPTDEPRLKVNWERQLITIPAGVNHLGVLRDNNARTVYFEADRYYKGLDVTDYTMILQFAVYDMKREQLAEGVYPIAEVDTESVDGKILFAWTVTDELTAQKGNVGFSIRLYKMNTIEGSQAEFEFCLNTKMATLPVWESLDVTEHEYETASAFLEEWNARMQAVYTATQAIVTQLKQWRDEAEGFKDEAVESAKSAEMSADNSAADADRADESADRAEVSANTATQAASDANAANEAVQTVKAEIVGMKDAVAEDAEKAEQAATKVEDAKDKAVEAAEAAESSAALAQSAAIKAEAIIKDIDKAEEYAESARQSANNAAQSATVADAAKEQVLTEIGNVQAIVSAAQSAEAGAVSAKDAAAVSAGNAESSAANAAASATLAGEKVTEASGYADAANTAKETAVQAASGAESAKALAGQAAENADKSAVLAGEHKADAESAAQEAGAARDEVVTMGGIVVQPEEPENPKTVAWVDTDAGTAPTISFITKDDNPLLAPVNAEEGKFLQISSVDKETGEVVVTAVDPPKSEVELTISLAGGLGNKPIGDKISVKIIVADIEKVIANTEFTGDPIVVKVPVGVKYVVTGSTDIAGFIKPTTVSDVAFEDVAIEIVYKEFGMIETWSDLKEIVDAGLAKQYVKVGDQFVTQWTDHSVTPAVTYDYPWDVTRIGNYEAPDGTVYEGVYLQAHYCTPWDIVFDAPENEIATEATAIEGLYYYEKKADNSYGLLNLNTGDPVPSGSVHSAIRDTSGNICRYGYNRVSHSAIRQWCNSDKPKNEWWKPQHIGDVAPSTLAQRPGFLAGFTSDDAKEFLSIVSPVRRLIRLNNITDGGISEYVVDKFFLPTCTNMMASGSVSEPPIFDYWKDATGYATPNNASNDNRKIFRISNHTQAANCWLASAGVGNSYFEWCVSASGYVNDYVALNAYAGVPACIIGKNLT